MTSTNHISAPATHAAPSASPLHGSRPRRVRWFSPVFWSLMCGGLVFMAVRSYAHADVLAVYSRAGDVQGVMSHHGLVLVAFSNLSLGPEKSLTADAASVTPDEGERLFEWVYKGHSPAEFRHFGFARTGRGELPGDATHVAFVAPHGFLAALAGLPVLFTLLGGASAWSASGAGGAGTADTTWPAR